MSVIIPGERVLFPGHLAHGDSDIHNIRIDRFIPIRRALQGACLLVVTTLVVSAIVAPASAGGSWLELRRVDGLGGQSTGVWGGWASSGSSVFMQGDFCGGQQADPSADSWTAYLRRDPSGPRLPLGAVNIDTATGNGCPYSASVTFTVPDVESGMYWVDVCADADCTTGVGDLVGGMFAVASTPLEALALTRLPNLRARLMQEARTRHALRGRVDSLREALRTANVDRGAFRADATRGEDAFVAREGLIAEADSARAAENIWRSVAIGSLLVLGLAVVYSLTKVIRRRRRVYVPEAAGELFSPQQKLVRRVHR